MEQTLERRVRVIPATKKLTEAGSSRRGKQRVAAYCRVSTDSEEQLNSYEAQKAYYTQKIEENPDWELAGIFADKGLSGTSMKKRDDFKRMIAACKRGRIDTILTKSLSRFARNTVDCLDTIRMLRARGIGVIFEKENINTLTESSEFLITLFSGFAQAESESLSENIIRGKMMSMQAGHVPFQYKKLLGYRKGADGRPEIDPEEAKTVRRIYRRYLDGCSLAQIQHELEADHVPTAQAIQRWSYQVIHNKASIFLGIFGVILTIVLTTESLNNLISIVQAAIAKKTFCDVLYLLMMAGFIIAMVFGLSQIIKVLGVKIDSSAEEGLDSDSKIFFEHIQKNNYSLYRKKLLGMTEEIFLNDIISQIYINSHICHNKYKNYKCGLKWTLVGFCGFSILWIIGAVILFWGDSNGGL